MRIIHPFPHEGTQVFIGIRFRNGVATIADLHPEREKALRQHGFTLETDVVDLASLTKAELREIADVEGVDVSKRATKPDIIEALSRVPAEPTDDANAMQES